MISLPGLLSALGVSLLPLQGVAVEGIVRTSEGDRPLVYAQVQVIGDSVADWTDDRGAYRLEGLGSGEWRVRVDHPGHRPLELSVAVPGDRPVRLDVTLEARPGPPVDALADFEPMQLEYTLPALLNGVSMSALLQRLYPPELARKRTGGEAVLLLWLDERGRVVRSEVASTSGQPPLDSLALAVSDSMRFRPARGAGGPVRVIVRIPVVFTVPDTARAVAGGSDRPS